MSANFLPRPNFGNLLKIFFLCSEFPASAHHKGIEWSFQFPSSFKVSTSPPFCKNMLAHVLLKICQAFRGDRFDSGPLRCIFYSCMKVCPVRFSFFLQKIYSLLLFCLRMMAMAVSFRSISTDSPFFGVYNPCPAIFRIKVLPL